MQEIRVRSLGWEDPLEKGMAIHSSILAWRIYSPWGRKESDTTEQLTTTMAFEEQSNLNCNFKIGQMLLQVYS